IPPQSSLGASMPPNPQRSGYSFGGWYTAVSGGSLFTALTPVNADIELWAGWILDIESDPTPPPQQPEPTGTPTPTPTPTPEPSPTPEDPEPTPEPTPTTEEPTPTPTPEDPEPEPQPELPPDRPGVIIVPGTPAVPPAPANPGSSLVPELNDDGEEILLEIGEDGVPLGEWHYEPVEEVWIYEPYTPMAEVPPTGDGGAYIAAALFAVSAMAFMALVKAGKKRA
ncbi:MAG: InlB B-repeat-containing protein, partial [Oscillospiraceae bacterium]|nr:InlB B-repeat-containing protein [Oscillospiraceae bacterium]